MTMNPQDSSPSTILNLSTQTLLSQTRGMTPLEIFAFCKSQPGIRDVCRNDMAFWKRTVEIHFGHTVTTQRPDINTAKSLRKFLKALASLNGSGPVYHCGFSVGENGLAGTELIPVETYDPEAFEDVGCSVLVPGLPLPLGTEVWVGYIMDGPGERSEFFPTRELILTWISSGIREILDQAGANHGFEIEGSDFRFIGNNETDAIAIGQVFLADPINQNNIYLNRRLPDLDLQEVFIGYGRFIV